MYLCLKRHFRIRHGVTQCDANNNKKVKATSSKTDYIFISHTGIERITHSAAHTSMLVALLLLPLLAHAAIPDPDQLRAGIVLRALAAIERETRLGKTINIEALFSPEDKDLLGLQKKQLIGGGSEYAPYSVPCPDGIEWVRGANVSFDMIWG